MLECIGKYWEGIVAFIALGVAMYQGWTTRQHNRLSVKPYIVGGHSTQDVKQ